MLPRSTPWLSLALPLTLVAADQQPVQSPQLSALYTQVGLTADQQSSVEKGQSVAKVLSWGGPSEVYVFGIVHINGRPAAYLKAARDIDKLRGTEGYLGIGEIPASPTEADLAGLTLERETLEKAIDQATQAIAEGREAVQDLRSSSVETADFAAVVGTLGDELLAGRTSPDFHVNVEGEPRTLAPFVRDEAYRIAREALRNAFQHADARQVAAEIRYDPRTFRLRVRDDGKGIDQTVIDAGGRAGHYGLPGMRERAEGAGGKLAVWSEVDSGTEVELTIPGTLAYAKSSDPRRSEPARVI